jgi:transcriptional regulator with XRE-family HTH domain
MSCPLPRKRLATRERIALGMDADRAMPFDDFALDTSPFLAMSPPAHVPCSGVRSFHSDIKLFDMQHQEICSNCSMMAKTSQKTRPTGANTPTAKRLRQLRAAERYETATAFARKLGISVSRYTNFETGKRLSIDVAQKIVQAVPGCTLDWLYNGEQRGLSLDLHQRLSMVEELEQRARAARGF